MIAALSMPMLSSLAYYDSLQLYCPPATFGFPGSLGFRQERQTKTEKSKIALWGGRFG